MYGQRDAGFFGYSHFTGGFPGGQAEYVRVPRGQVNLLPIPNEVPDEKAIYLSDILPTSYHTVVDTGVEKGDVIGIWVSYTALKFLVDRAKAYTGFGSDRSICGQMGAAKRRLSCHWY